MDFDFYSKIFTFGKYKNSKVEDIIEINPSYVKWALDNVKYFTLSPILSKKLEEKLQTTQVCYYDYYSRYACEREFSSGYLPWDAFYDYSMY